EGQQRAAPHSSSFPPTTAPLHTLHMDVWGPVRVSGQGCERYFLEVVDDYTHYTTVFPLGSKAEVPDVLIPWIRAVRLQLRERFREDHPFLRLHFDRGGEFSSDLLRGFFRGEGILHTFTLPASPQQNGIAECRIGLVMEVAPQPLVPCLLAGDLAHTTLDREGARAAGGTGAASLGGARTGVTRAAGACGAAGVGAGDPGAGDTGAGGAGPGGAGAVSASSGDTRRPRPNFVPLLQQTGGHTDRREPVYRPASPLRAVCTSSRISRQRSPPVPGTHHMALRPSSVPSRVPLPSPPTSSLADGPDTESDLARAARTTVPRLLAIVVIDPSFESTAASALVADLVDFAAAYRHDYAASLVAESESICPPFVAGECALGTDVLEDRQEDFEHPDPALLRRIMGPYSSQWLTAMDAEMASWKFAGTYVDAVPPPRANIVDGMCIFRGSLHEEIWLRRPPGFTGSFLAGTQWSLRRPVYGLRQAPRDWHDTLRMTLAALGFAPSTAGLSLFLRTDTSLPPLYVLVYVDNLVFATADTESLTLVKSEVQKRHTCTDLGELRSYLGLEITLTQSHMVHQVLQCFGFRYSSPQSTPLPTGHSLSAPPFDESVEPSGVYPELVGCLMYLMTYTRPDLAYPLSILARYVAPGRNRPEHWEAAKRVLCYLCSTSSMGLVLGGRGPVVLTGHADASWVDDLATQHSSCEAEIYTGGMAAQDLRWLTYLLTDLGERPGSSPVLYVDNKAMIALCQEHRLEQRMKHIALRYFLARELQQRGQLHLAYVATRANTADIFTKALQSGDHQRFCTVLGLVPTLPHLLTA
ncbi:unnamed protein product, partial [Closterium sp. NIES-53]